METIIKPDIVIIKGNFYGLSSGILGGFGEVDFVFNHTIPEKVLDEFDKLNPKEYVKKVAQDNGIEGKYFGLITAVSMERLRVVKRNEVTAFITAGIKNHNQKINAGTINIILHLEANLQDSALINVVITATEAKSMALLELGYDFTGTSTDAVVVIRDRNCSKFYEYAGPESTLGKCIWEAVKEGVKRSLKD